MDLRLKGQIAVITGSSQGIGLSIAESLIAEGVSVGLNGRNPDKLKDAVSGLGDRAFPILADLATAAGREQFVQTWTKVPDILIHNVAYNPVEAFLDAGDDPWTQAFAINLLAPVWLTRHYLPQFLARGTGRILFIGTEASFAVDPDMLSYACTKTAQLPLVRGIAKLTRDTGITVNAVLPGPTWTPGNQRLVEAYAEERGLELDMAKRAIMREKRGGSLIGRFIEPHEIAAFVTFLCSPLASAITGSVLRADGGLIDSYL